MKQIKKQFSKNRPIEFIISIILIFTSLIPIKISLLKKNVWEHLEKLKNNMKEK